MGQNKQFFNQTQATTLCNPAPLVEAWPRWLPHRENEKDWISLTLLTHISVKNYIYAMKFSECV